MGRKNSVGTANGLPNGLPNGERAGGAAAGSGAPIPRHLLVMRTSAMGDVAMLPHALRALTAAYPDLRVTVATQAMFRPFFAGLDVGFLDVDVKGAHHSLAGMWRLAAQARRLGVDAVADVHDVLRSKAFRLAMRLHGVPAAHIDKGRAGKRAFIRCGGRGMEGVEPFLKECRSREKSLFLLVKTSNPSSGELQNRDMEGKPLYARMAEMVAKWGEGLDTPCGYNQIGAVVGATYPEEQSRELVRMLSERYGRVFIHGGGGAEQAFAEEMERTYPNVTALYGKVRFAGEMDLIANLDCVVTMDSLVMHLASLVATPVVSVWGATHPGLGFLGYGVSPGNVLQADMACRPCSVFGNKPCRYGDYRCLKAVTPEMAARRVAEITGSLPECPGNG